MTTITEREAYYRRLAAAGTITGDELASLLKLYDRARAEIRAMGKAMTRQETVAIYARYKLHPSEDELIAIGQ